MFNNSQKCDDGFHSLILNVYDITCSVTHRHVVTTAFRQLPSTCRTAFPTQYLPPSGILSCWPDSLKLTPEFYPGYNEQHRLF